MEEEGKNVTPAAIACSMSRMRETSGRGRGPLPWVIRRARRGIQVRVAEQDLNGGGSCRLQAGAWRKHAASRAMPRPIAGRRPHCANKGFRVSDFQNMQIVQPGGQSIPTG